MAPHSGSNTPLASPRRTAIVTARSMSRDSQGKPMPVSSQITGGGCVSPQGQGYPLASYSALPAPISENLRIEPESSSPFSSGKSSSSVWSPPVPPQSILKKPPHSWQEALRAFGWRELAIFAAGALASGLGALCVSGLAPAGTQDAVVPPGLAMLPCERLMARRNLSLTDTQDPGGLDGRYFESRQSGTYAFVQMAWDSGSGDGQGERCLWQVLAMARALQRLSSYPLVLMTNQTHFPDGKGIGSLMWKLNVQVVPVYEVPLPSGVRLGRGERPRFWQLQVWRLTQFDKLIWLDTDAIVYRSLDWLFDRRPNWAARDDAACSHGEGSGLSLGVLLLEPSEDTYQKVLAHASNYAGRADLRVSELVSHYFKDVVGRPVELLNSWEVSYGACLGGAKSVPYDSSALWNYPAVVHKSSPGGECFYFDTAQQLKLVRGTVVNVCHFHPLGHYWRDRFCEAARIVGTIGEKIAAFCDDGLWNLFVSRAPQPAGRGGDLNMHGVFET